MQFCRDELKDLPRSKGSPLLIALKIISLYVEIKGQLDATDVFFIAKLNV
jgi:hypothetical protein